MAPAPDPSPALTIVCLLSAWLVAVAAPTSHAGLVHRWSFNEPAGPAPDGTTLPDSTSSLPATIEGQGASFSGTGLVLPGGGTGQETEATIPGYIDLPNGVLSSKVDVTIEFWAAPLSSQTWQRIFAFGSMAGPGDGAGAFGEWTGTLATAPGNVAVSDEFSLTFNIGDNINAQRLYGRLDYDTASPVNLYLESALATVVGQRYHYVVTFEDGVGTHGPGGGRQSWYRDGVLVGFNDLPYPLSAVSDVNNWIGRSQFTQDPIAHMELDEFRIYDHALSQAEIDNNLVAGPDSVEDLDADDDGLLDLAFEDHYFGNGDGNATPGELALQDGSGDPDGDGHTNLEEQALGSDPTDAQSPPPAPVPVRLWDFNAPAGSAPDGFSFTDIGAGEVAVVHGNGAILTGTELLIGDNGSGGRQTTNGVQAAGDISAYLELPNHFLSGFEGLSIEGWITPRSSGAWQRVWDFGNATVTHGPGALEGEIIDSDTPPPGFVSNDNLFLSMNVDGALGAHRLGGKIDGGGETYTDDDLSPVTSAGTEYHFVMTVANGVGTGGPGGCRVEWYRDGVAHGSIDLPFRLEDLQDVNNWIGRSSYSGDQNSHLSLNELRVYDRVLTQQEIDNSHAAGTDVGFPAPTANNDTATLHEGRKVLVDVLANDGGGPDATTVAIATPPAHGTLEVRPDGRILYTHAGGTAPDAFTYTVSGLGGTSSPATVDLTIATDLRIDNPAWAMPGEAPATSWQLVDALPGLTFDQPLGITTIPGDTRQLFVLERMAKVKRIPDVTAALPTQNVFLDLQQVVAGRTPVETVANWTDANVANGDQNGLQGMAFHPDFASNGYFFVAYTVRIDGGAHYQRISRFEADPGDPTAADPASETVFLQQLDDGFDHNGGDLHFGPDGYLYYAAGDGVNNDGNNDPYDNSQTITKDFFTGIFRIDVDKRPGNLEPNPHPAIPTDGGIARFSVPIDNPFVHTSLGGDWDGTFNDGTITALGSVRTEFWATGLRHVWRMSFDSATGDLWAGDVGQTRHEEVNKIVRGGNYGWVYREGAHDNAQKPPPAGFTSIDPFYEYVHNAFPGDGSLKGNSVCGGYVYHGTRFPELEGSYVFSDSINGHVWRMDTTTAEVVRLTGVGGGWGAIAGQGIDPSNQDLLFCDYIPGKIRRLAKGGDLSTGFPQTLTETGLFSDLADLTPAPGMLPYQPNLRFWSDHADKTRWFGIPDGTSQVTWQQEGPWTHPAGMVWVKHFDLALTRGDPATNKRIETRVLVKTGDGVYGVSYRWNDAGTEAHLVEDAGVAFDLVIDDGGIPHTQTWEIPGRSSCLTCHGDRPLSFTTRQLNQVGTMNGFTGNQIDLLHDAGYLANTPDPVATLPAHVRPDQTDYPLEQRVRSYLDVNCAYCHQDGGSVGGFWDGREQLTLEQTGIVHGAPAQNGGDPANAYIVPGDPLHSVILQRAGATNGFSRMPPLASSEVDQEGIDLLTEWILTLPADRLYDDWAAIHALLGGRDDDDDHDGRSNRAEFLMGSDPHSGKDIPPITIADGNLEFLRQPYRAYNILKSTDLSSWTRWNVPENVKGYQETGLMESIPIETSEPAAFFRLEIREP